MVSGTECCGWCALLDRISLVGVIYEEQMRRGSHNSPAYWAEECLADDPPSWDNAVKLIENGK